MLDNFGCAIKLILSHVTVQLRAAGEQAKAKHDGPRGDIIYAETQKDFADYEEVLAQVFSLLHLFELMVQHDALFFEVLSSPRTAVTVIFARRSSTKG